MYADCPELELAVIVGTYVMIVLLYIMGETFALEKWAENLKRIGSAYRPFACHLEFCHITC